MLEIVDGQKSGLGQAVDNSGHQAEFLELDSQAAGSQAWEGAEHRGLMRKFQINNLAQCVLDDWRWLSKGEEPGRSQKALT